MVDPGSAAIALSLVKPVLPKVATELAKAVKSKLNPSELQKALEAGIGAAEEQSSRVLDGLFFRCDDKQKSTFLQQVFENSAVQAELQKPLTQSGNIDTALLKKAFEQIQAHLNTPLKAEYLDVWIQTFTRAYFERTSTFLNFQVAKENYLRQLIRRFDDIKFAGIPVEGQESDLQATLLKIFVMPDVMEDKQAAKAFQEAELRELPDEASWQAQQMREQQLQMQQKQTSRRLPASQLLGQNVGKKAVILGSPGSGKTTLLKYFAVITAKRALTSQDKQINQTFARLGLDSLIEWLPILIPIRELERHLEQSILDYARNFAENNLCVVPLPSGFFDYWLNEGRALILLDGLDEADRNRRSVVAERINSFLDQFDHNPAIVTSRFSGYRRSFFNTQVFSHYELLPFNDDQINEFINHWYDSRIADPEETKRSKQSLREAFSNNERIKLLAYNPLLLTIIALIHRQQARLPRQRYKLYDKAVDTLLISWDEEKQLSNRVVLHYIQLDDLRRLMEQLAYWIHTQGKTRDKDSGTLIDRNELLQQLSQMICKEKKIKLYEAQKEAERFVGFIRERTGLLNEQGQDCYAFVHKTFQEYLCSKEIDYQLKDTMDFTIAEKIINNYLHNSHWREVLLLLIAQQTPNIAAKAIRTVLNRKSDFEQWLYRDLLLAGACLAEDIKMRDEDSSLCRKVLIKLIKLEIHPTYASLYSFRYQIFQIICSLGGTAFQASALQLLKEDEVKIEKVRFQHYRYALGEQEEALSQLILLLNDTEPDIRSNALRVLGRLGKTSEAVIRALISSLNSLSPNVRFSAAEALGHLGISSNAVIEALIHVLKTDIQDYVVSGAAEALGHLGISSNPVIEALLPLLQHPSQHVISSAAEALGHLGNTSAEAVKALLSLLEHPSSYVRCKVAEVLINMDLASEQVIKILLLLLQDTESYIRYRTVEVLGKLTKNLLTDLGGIKEEVITELILLLEDPEPYVRSNTARALGELGRASDRVITTLLSLIHDQPYVRSSAAEVLGRLGNDSEEVITTLLILLKDPEPYVRFNASSALVGLGYTSEEVVTTLLLLLTDLQSSARTEAAELLGKLSKPAKEIITALLPLLKDSGYVTRHSSAIALAQLAKKSDEALNLLVDWVQEHQNSEFVSHGIFALWESVQS